MDSLLEQLYRQHREAERMLDRLADARRTLQREGPAAPGLRAELADVRGVLQAEIESHFREEEWSLFPVLGRHLGLESGPIAAMMDDHAAFRRLQLDFDTAFAALSGEAEDGWAERLGEAASGVLDLLPAHIAKEDNVLFPMADDLLSDAEWKLAGRLWVDPRSA